MPLPRLLPVLACVPLAVAGALAAAQTAAPREVPEPKVEHLTIEERDVRIDELRIRGQTKTLSVKPKGAPEYEIVPPNAAKPIDDKTEGRRTWRLLTF
jgi:hypothetical protein